MIILSDQFSKLSKGVYTFSFICIGIKFLPIETIPVGAFRIDADNKDIIAGAVGLALILTTFACFIFLLRDYYLTRISDDVSDQEIGDIKGIDFSQTSSEEVKRLERFSNRLTVLSWFGFLVAGISPIILGIVSSIIIWPDMVHFIQNIERA